MKKSVIIYCGFIAATIAFAPKAYAQTSETPEAPETPETREPNVDILTLYIPSEDNAKARGFLLVDTGEKMLQSLTVHTYNNYYELKEGPSLTFTPSSNYEIIPFEIESAPDGVIRLEYLFEGETSPVMTSYWQNGEYFDYMSDLPAGIYTGWGSSPAPNKPYGDQSTTVHGVLELGTAASPRVYAKGFGWHADGRAESTADLSPYYKFTAEMGGQRITNNTHTQELKFNVQNGAAYLRTDTVVKFSDILKVEGKVNGMQKIIINGRNNGDNTNAVIAVGAPRLYYQPNIKAPQQIVWEEEASMLSYRPSTVVLDASASSGLENVYYRVVSGNATVSGNILTVGTPGMGGETVVVEALQPGNEAWAPAEPVRKSFRFTRGLEVLRDEDITLNGSQQLDLLVVHADRESSGQVRVKNGVANVGALALKYTFTPGEWCYISFPADVNLDQISDLGEKGYSLNNDFAGAYYISEYSPMSDQPWTMLTTPEVKGSKGYLMGINDAAGTDPVEITFNFDNLHLDFSNHELPVGLTLDLTGVENGTTQKIHVTPENVEGSQLEIDLVFNPEDTSSLPINYERALGEARYTFVGEKKAMRFTLPDQTPARVVFFDRNGRKVIKAVRYVSPMAIDITDLKPGIYNVVVGYGNAIRTFVVEI